MGKGGQTILYCALDTLLERSQGLTGNSYKRISQGIKFYDCARKFQSFEKHVYIAKLFHGTHVSAQRLVGCPGANVCFSRSHFGLAGAHWFSLKQK